MSEHNLLEEHVNSDNALIKSMYSDLNSRIQEFENGNSRIERIKLKDATGSIIIVGAIILFLASVIL
ncbi:hypothetical protein [Bacillus massiliigorillae]|uniref:hypothetical protein n=1 Tax=Bacillus massiliigorillae TaxID=1243664 RepID=UPI0003A2726E|nr:hypothetical protein [Bacillus massiliigorillae]